MSVVAMKKAYLIAHSTLKLSIIDTLQEEGLIDITNLREEITEADMIEVIRDHETNVKELELELSQIEFALSFIARFEDKEKGLLTGLIKEKVDIGWDKYKSIRERVNFAEVYKTCEELDAELSTLKNKETQLAVLRESLVPWASLDIKLQELGATKKTQVVLGEMPLSNFSALLGEFKAESVCSLVEVVSQDSKTAHVCLIFMDEESDDIYSLLHKQGFRQASFTELVETPKQEITNIGKAEKLLEKERRSLVKKAKKLVLFRSDLLVLQDFLRNEIEKEKVQEKFAQTKQAFLIEGWVRAKDTDRLSKRLSKISKQISLSFEDSKLDDNPPTVLENKNWLKPFEIVTRLYGTPNYRELDPTPFMAPFFLVFFGLCIGDVVYGAVLILACWYLRKKLPVSATVKSFMTLLIYGGFSSMVVGAVTGSWFTIETQKLPSALRAIVIFEPLEEPVFFLIICIMLGLGQLWFGLLLELLDNARQGKIVDGLLKQGARLIFLPGMAVLIASFLGGGKGGVAAWVPVAKWLAIVGALMVIIFSRRETKNWLARIGSGMYDLYGMSSYLGDTISYARLMALGLATFLIGWAFNIIGGLMFTGIFGLRGSIPGFIIMIVLFVIAAVIFISLHVLNLLISLISAFVHPARLQYVEFFSKFFDGGGKKYQPFSVETKNSNIK